MSDVLVYNFHPEFKYLTGVEPADPNPREEDEYIIPAHSTLVVAPLFDDNEIPVFDDVNEEWNLEPDFRDLSYWDDKGEKFTITNIGESPPDWALFSETQEANAARNRSEAKKLRDKSTQSPLDLLGHSWQVNPTSRDNIRTAIDRVKTLELNPDTESRLWILADNTLRDTTASELQQILDAYADRLDSVYKGYYLWLETDMLTPFALSE